MSPRLGVGMSPRLGVGMSPRLGVGMSPRLGVGMSPRLGVGMSPRLGVGMSPRRVLACLAVALTLTGAVTLMGAAGASARPYQSFYSVISQFMCVECHEPLSQVTSPEAISEKTTLRALIKRDLTLGQIKAGMVAQYGEQVLARPPASGFNLAVYILPPAIFLGGLALLAYTLPKWRERSRRAAASRLPGAPPLEADDAKRLDDELSHFI